MENENETNLEETNETTEEVGAVSTDDQTQSATETPEEKIARLEKENKTLKIQKGKIKEKAQEAPKVEKQELSQLDVIALAKADIHEEDMERVTKFAQMEGMSVKDALGNEDMKAILERRAETRRAAEASNTGSNKSGTVDVSGDALLEKASHNNMPDVKDLSKMWDAENKK